MIKKHLNKYKILSYNRPSIMRHKGTIYKIELRSGRWFFNGELLQKNNHPEPTVLLLRHIKKLNAIKRWNHRAIEMQHKAFNIIITSLALTPLLIYIIYNIAK